MPTSIYDINRKHSVNDKFFENVTTEIQAYWLGFIWADGSISKTAKRCSGPNRLTVSQKTKELQHLKRFAETIQSNADIHDREPMPNKYVSILDINSRPLCMSLEKLGYDVKSKRIRIPPMPQNLIRHFIRGYFDGDGGLSLYMQKCKKWTVKRQEFSITGNPVLIDEIQTILNQETSVSQKVHPKPYKRTTKVVSLRYGRQSDIDTLFHYLYDNASVYMKSKHQKFIDYYSRQSNCGLQSDAL